MAGAAARHMTQPDPLVKLRDRLRRFATERDWEQFHSPKNLAIALNVEAGELLEHFQWLTDDASRSLPARDLARVREELADVLLYLIRLADQLGVDLLAAAAAKIDVNARKYPADKARGSSRKYTDL
jgi:dCTP diphosphatase